MKKKTGHTLAEFETKFEHSPLGQERIAQLKKQVAHLAGPGKARSVSIPCDDEITIGLVSCSHYGSLYSDGSDLNYFYDHAKEQGAEFVLHCGDVCDGHRIYKGQEFEQDCIGWEAQADRFEKVAPDQLPDFVGEAGLEDLADIRMQVWMPHGRIDFALEAHAFRLQFLDSGQGGWAPAGNVLKPVHKPCD